MPNTIAERLSLEEISDLFLTNKGNNSSVDLIDSPILSEFRIFNNKDIRNYIEKDLNINLLELSLKEQIYFLISITEKNNLKMGPVRDFVKTFKEQGLKTFLSLEHGGKEMGDKILNIGNALEQKDAEKIFESYSLILEEADKIKNNIEKTFPENKVVASQIFEALLVKAKDILLSAEYISNKEHSSEYTIQNLQKALDGILLQLSILNDLEKKEKFVYEKVSENNQTKRLKVSDISNGFEYDVRFLARSYAEKTAQARVSMEIIFDTEKPNKDLQEAFNQKILYKETGKEIEKSALRFSIDRDTNLEEAFVSLDMGSSSFDGTKISRTGDVFGNSLSLISEYGSHTPQGFSKEFADPDIFAGFVTKIQEKIKEI